MKGVRFTKAELAFIRDCINSCSPFVDLDGHKLQQRVFAKLDEAKEPKAKGADVGPIQDALIAAARGKVVKLEGQYARASRQCADAGVTPDSAKMVGEWMARQGWLTGPMTLLDVLNKWGSWLAKAKATAPPPSLEPGFGQSGQGASAPSPAPPGRRPPQGFR